MKNEIFFGRNKKITYWQHNPEKSRTIILVHGFTGSHEGFQYLVPLLSEYRLIIPDLPGFGVSPLPHNRQSLGELGASINELTKLLDTPKKPILLGHSMGSLVVAEAIRQNPELYREQLILISPVPSAIKWLDSRKLGAALGSLHYKASHSLPGVGNKLAHSKLITKVSTKLIVTTKDKNMRKKIYQHHYGNLDHISDVGWYGRLHHEINQTGTDRYSQDFAPFNVLVITGSKDAVTPLKHQLKMIDKIKAKVKIIPNVGHLAHYEKPHDLAKAISDFLE